MTLIDIRQLIAFLIDCPIVGVARPDSADAFLEHIQFPAGQTRAVGVVVVELALMLFPVLVLIGVEHRVELFHIVARHHPCRTDEHIDPHRQAVRREWRRCIEDHLEGIVIRCVEGHQRAGAGSRFIRRGVDRLEAGGELLLLAVTANRILPPVHDVLCGERLTIAPLDPLADLERPLARVRIRLPAFNKTGTDRQSILEPAQRRRAILHLVDETGNTPVVVVGLLQHTAILADGKPGVGRRVGVLRQALIHRRQLALLHQFRQHRRFFELGCHRRNGSRCGRSGRSGRGGRSGRLRRGRRSGRLRCGRLAATGCDSGAGRRDG
jgi:hypothetical protein